MEATNVATGSPPFPLMRLPSELRINIFAFAEPEHLDALDEHFMIEMHCDTKWSQAEIRNTLAFVLRDYPLTRVSRLLRQEAADAVVAIFESWLAVQELEIQTNSVNEDLDIEEVRMAVERIEQRACEFRRDVRDALQVWRRKVREESASKYEESR